MVAKPGHLVGLELDRPDRALDRVGASGNEVDGLSRFQSRFGERNAQPDGSIGDVEERQNRQAPPWRVSAYGDHPGPQIEDLLCPVGVESRLCHPCLEKIDKAPRDPRRGRIGVRERLEQSSLVDRGSVDAAPAAVALR